MRKVLLETHILILLDHLLLGFGNDALELVETALHLGEAHPCGLLLLADALQLFFALFLSDAGALLPLLDTLREDLIDPTAEIGRSINQYDLLKTH